MNSICYLCYSAPEFFIIEFVDGEEARELQEFADEKRRIEEEKKDQLNLFGD